MTRSQARSPGGCGSERTRSATARACDVDCEAAAHLAMRDLALARQAAAPLFEGRMTCAEVPALTYGRFLLPLSQAGQDAEAERLRTSCRAASAPIATSWSRRVPFSSISSTITHGKSFAPQEGTPPGP